MTLQEVKQIANQLNELHFELENGHAVPKHFHITEVGLSTKQFIDCGGTQRKENKINFQLWVDSDVEHRLSPAKFLKIVSDVEQSLALDQNLEVEVEYQQETVGKYALAFKDSTFILQNTLTDCLAKDVCLPKPKKKLKLSDLGTAKNTSCCSPDSGCC